MTYKTPPPVLSRMSSRSSPRTRLGWSTRLDVTDLEADRLPDRAERQRVEGSEVHLERYGGRTYLVTDPAPKGRS